jgi:glycosyltransferase involved in cell wall biosynthesis
MAGLWNDAYFNLLRMNILFLTPWYPNPRYPLEGSFVESQALALAREGMDITVACLHLSPYGFTQPVRRWYRLQKSKEKKLDVIRLEGPFFPKRNTFFIKAWAQWVSRLLVPFIQKNKQIDLLHAHTQLGAIAAYFLSKKTGLPYVVTLHESSFLANKVFSWHSSLLKAALEGASEVMCVSNALRECLDRQFSGITNLSTIPNNIDLQLFSPPEKRPPHPPFLWIAVGDLKPIKQFDLLIRAFKKITETEKDVFKLRFIGYGPEQKKLEQLVKELELEKQVSFIGYLSPSAVPAELQKAHALALTSRLETFGIVLAEALACGLPVLATDCGGPRDIINQERGVIVAESSVEAVAAGMMEIYRNYGRFDGKKLSRYAGARFGDAVVAQKIIKTYRG